MQEVCNRLRCTKAGQQLGSLPTSAFWCTGDWRTDALRVSSTSAWHMRAAPGLQTGLLTGDELHRQFTPKSDAPASGGICSSSTDCKGSMSQSQVLTAATIRIKYPQLFHPTRKQEQHCNPVGRCNTVSSILSTSVGNQRHHEHHTYTSSSRNDVHPPVNASCKLIHKDGGLSSTSGSQWGTGASHPSGSTPKARLWDSELPSSTLADCIHHAQHQPNEQPTHHLTMDSTAAALCCDLSEMALEQHQKVCL